PPCRGSPNTVPAWWLIAFAPHPAIHKFVRLSRPGHPIVVRHPPTNVPAPPDLREDGRRPSHGGGRRSAKRHRSSDGEVLWFRPIRFRPSPPHRMRQPPFPWP